MKRTIATLLIAGSLAAQTPAQSTSHPKLHKIGHHIARDLKETAEIIALVGLTVGLVYVAGSSSSGSTGLARGPVVHAPLNAPGR